ncbi:hypothetical protein [Acidothermus cellulolyticus]|uniref:hypothetical protein n=1 Tax=Acidothermus cellulolyticus TaxID=28049 RepID=UPI0005A0C163|nr:hypothetical protein [Acidothermus cellulolyticus]
MTDGGAGDGVGVADEPPIGKLISCVPGVGRLGTLGGAGVGVSAGRASGRDGDGVGTADGVCGGGFPLFGAAVVVGLRGITTTGLGALLPTG